MSRKKPAPDDVAQYLGHAGRADALVANYAASVPKERLAAAELRELLPPVRKWADSLGARDRVGLAMALYVAIQAEYLHAAAYNLHADAELGRRIAHRGLRKPPPRKANHDAIVMYAANLAKSGEKQHNLARLTRFALRPPITLKAVRTILQDAGLVRRRKGK
jgi:hypothetical protein